MSLANISSALVSKFRAPRRMSLQEYLDLCKVQPLAFASAAERMVAAIGEPEIVDTSEDQRASRIFSNRTIRRYAAFEGFYGIDDTIERIVSYFRNAAAGLEESKSVLLLLGPVGSSKSSIAERLKSLMSKHPIYVLADLNERDPDLQISPTLDSPLSLFTREHGEFLSEYGIEPRHLETTVLSGWAQQKLREFDGDITKFTVVEIYPDKDKQQGIMKIEPGDENNQDVSVLVGKTDLRRLDRWAQSHPYAYSYAGGLNRSNQGMLEYCEMLKSSLKTLNPILMATQERNYNGTEAIPSMPFTGIILAHTNESEWDTFRQNRNNEAFLDRIFIVKAPYCVRYTEEEEIYKKMLRGSSLGKAPIAPGTLTMLAKFMVLTRLVEPANSVIYAKLCVYNGENVKDKMTSAKPIEEYRDLAGPNEGMSGLSTRLAFKLISATFDMRPGDVQANPVDLLCVLDNMLRAEGLPEKVEAKYRSFIKDYLLPQYMEFLEKELREAYLESFETFGQNMFERYVLFAEAWIEDSGCRDPETGVQLDRAKLNAKLEDIEKSSNIYNPKDFRNEIVHYFLRYRARNEGRAPRWNEYEKIRSVLEKKMFSATADILPVISFGPKQDSDLAEKHDKFIERMINKGYTTSQIKQLVAFWTQNKKAS